jgi:hypothetical protein
MLGAGAGTFGPDIVLLPAIPADMLDPASGILSGIGGDVAVGEKDFSDPNWFQ